MNRPTATDLKARALAAVDSLSAEAISIAEDLHGHPEGGLGARRALPRC